MSKRSPQVSVLEFRFTHVWDDEIVPVERYFTAKGPEEAIDMFAYTCSKTGRKPILHEIAQWDRWAQSWTALPIPEREEYTLAEDESGETAPPPEGSSELTDDSSEKALTPS